MGFDLQIRISLGICQETGKAFYYSQDYSKKYDLESSIVPEEYRKFFQLHGRFLHAYTDHFNEESQSSVDLHVFFEEFPNWTTVKEFLDENYKDFWTEMEHTQFRKTLEWCVESGISYRVEWC